MISTGGLISVLWIIIFKIKTWEKKDLDIEEDVGIAEALDQRNEKVIFKGRVSTSVKFEHA